jgi:hypothetical protein
MARVDLVSVKEILGHKDIQTILRYSHLAPGHLREAVNRGSLNATVTKTVTGLEGQTDDCMQPIDLVVRPTGVEPVTPRSVGLLRSDTTVEEPMITGHDESVS